mmetsp:Transcript_113997/g.322432  ORF Transcript_113997/g.322432 Transcript_113997/m.322432 type:complete len:379 (-) Transcript_113997:141-1277(-)
MMTPAVLSVSALLSIVHRPVAWADYTKPFRVAHYNILASYLADNRNPWFLFPLNLSDGEREAIMAKNYERDSTGAYRNTFTNGFGGLISQSQMDEVSRSEWPFQWTYRGPRLLNIVKTFDADLLSLVEMDRFEEFQSALNATHEGEFLKRPRKQSLDGSSIFWRRGRFELVSDPLHVTFEDREPRQGEAYREDRVMLAVALRDKLTDNVFVVASAHLMRNPEDTGKDAMRILEASQMMRSLSCLFNAVGASGLIIMGDFNAVPESWTHLFFLHGWQDCPELDKGMRDAFDQVEWGCPGCHDAHPLVCTTRTIARAMWVDYIFYSSRTLELNGEPQVESCPEGPIPDDVHPSDHLPVRASFYFKRDEDESVAIEQHVVE